MKTLAPAPDLYRGARILGDIEAIEKGPTAVAKRVERQLLWRFFGRILGRWTR
jgi:hypothetical protein